MVMSIGLPFLLIDYFNCTVDDKKADKHFKVDRNIKEFHNFLISTRLLDLVLQGLTFTWYDNILGMARVGSILIMPSNLWLDLFSLKSLILLRLHLIII